MPKFGSIYPRKCDDCGNTYKEKTGFLKHRKHGICKKYQDREAIKHQPTIIDARTKPNVTPDSDITIIIDDKTKINLKEVIDYDDAWDNLTEMKDVLNMLRNDTQSWCKELLLFVVQEVFCKSPIGKQDILQKVCIIKDKDAVKYLQQSPEPFMFHWKYKTKNDFLDMIINDTKMFLKREHKNLIHSDPLKARLGVLVQDYCENKQSEFNADRKWLFKKIWEAFKCDTKRSRVKKWHKELETHFNLVDGN